jgi:hypothetical protein
MSMYGIKRTNRQRRRRRCGETYNDDEDAVETKTIDDNWQKGSDE